MEELLLETPEEPLRGRVVRTASLRAHRTRQTVLAADADPFGPPVAAAAIRMDDWSLPVPERGARVGEHAVGQCRVRARADRPCHRHAVVAVDHGRQVGLAGRNRELREVRDPQHVRPLGVEVAVRQVLRGFGELALVRAVPLRALEQRLEPVLRHEPHDSFRRYTDAHAFQLQVDPLVPVAASAVLERLAHEFQQRCVPVGTFHGGELVMICAARDADHGQQAFGRHAKCFANGLDEEGFLSAGQVFRVCARLFSQQLQRALPDHDLDVELAFGPPPGLDAGVQPVQTGLHLRKSPLHRRHRVRQTGRVPGTGRVRRRQRLRAGFSLPGRRGLPSGCLYHVRLLGSGKHPPFPVSHDGWVDPQFGGRLTRFRPSGHDRDHRLPLQFLGDRAVPRSALAWRQLVDSCHEQRPAFRIAQTSHRARHAAPMREVVVFRQINPRVVTS